MDLEILRNGRGLTPGRDDDAFTRRIILQAMKRTLYRVVAQFPCTERGTAMGALIRETCNAAINLSIKNQFFPAPRRPE
jgi:hypothetical protein